MKDFEEKYKTLIKFMLPQANKCIKSVEVVGFEEGALTAREKSLIALAVAHTEQCPYCIDAYSKDGLERGITKEEMMEAIHVGAAIKSGATLVHGVQMMNKVNKLDG